MKIVQISGRYSVLVISTVLFLAACGSWLADRWTLAIAQWSTQTPAEPSANGYLIGRGGGSVLICRGCFDERPGFKVQSAPRSPNAALEVVIWYCVTGDNEGAFNWKRFGLIAVIGPADWGSHTWAVVFPDWFLVALFGAWPGLWVLRYRERRARSRVASGLCGQCGYDVRSSPDRCPECGTSIEADRIIQTPVSGMSRVRLIVYCLAIAWLAGLSELVSLHAKSFPLQKKVAFSVTAVVLSVLFFATQQRRRDVRGGLTFLLIGSAGCVAMWMMM